MKKLTSKSKFKHPSKKRPFAGKRKLFKKAKSSRHFITNLDRFYAVSKRPLRRIQFKLYPNKVTQRLRRQLRCIGISGTVVVRRSAASIRRFLTQSYPHRQAKSTVAVVRPLVWTTPKKYRLKSALFAAQRRARPTLRLATRQTLRRTHLTLNSRPGTRVASLRRRFAFYARLQNLRRLSAARKFITRRRRVRRARAKLSPRRRWLWHKARGQKKHLKKLGRISTGAPLVHSRGTRAHRVIVTTVHRQLTWLKALHYRRRRKQRRGLVIKTIRTRTSGRLVRLRRRFPRHAFSIPQKRRRWRITRRDTGLLKRARKLYTTKLLTARTTAKARFGLRTVYSSFRRVMRNTTLQHLDARATTRLHATTAYLRGMARQALRRECALTLSSARLPRYRRRTVSRLDVRARRNKRASAGRHVAFPLPAVTGNAPAMRAVLRAGRRWHAVLGETARKKWKQYLVWRFYRSAYRLSSQRRLRSGALLKSAVARPNSVVRVLSAQTLLQSRRGRLTLDAAQTFFSQTLQNKLDSGVTIVQNLPAAVPATVGRSALPTTRLLGKSLSPRLLQRHFGFLPKVIIKNWKQPYTRQELYAKATLLQEQRRYHELQFYRRRPKLSLPRTALSRQRKRRSGKTTFLRNSLRRPRTFQGQQRMLFPPVCAYNAAVKLHAIGQPLRALTLTPTARSVNAYPVFWKRPHNRANRRAVNKVRNRRYLTHRKFYQKDRARSYTAVNTPLNSISAAAIPYATAPRSVLQQQLSAEAHTRQAALAGLGFVVSKSPRSQPVTARHRKGISEFSPEGQDLMTTKRTLDAVTPVRSRRTVVAALTTVRKPVTALKLHSLWQARSVRAMLASERALSAWSPRISARNLARHSPRRDGIPSRRRRLTFKALRTRRAANALRLRRGVPQRRYNSNTRVKLQYLTGSAGAAGYLRYRRAYRPHSRQVRWWRPITLAVPFAHPYSRRELNATRYFKKSLSRALVPTNREFNKIMDPAPGEMLRKKFPSRVIPWRNFHYRKPRHRDAPRTVERWTFTSRSGKSGRTKPGRSTMAFARQSRKRHALHGAISSHGLYKNRRWGMLDSATLTAIGTGQFHLAVIGVPESVWSAVRQKSGSTAAYVAARGRIFNKFRAWICKRQQAFSRSTTDPLVPAQRALYDFIHGEVTHQRATSSALSSATQHTELRTGAFSALVDYKATEYLKLSALPRIDAELEPELLTRREQSKTYKRWLSGVEGMLKRTQGGYIPTKRSRYSDNVAILFGRNRVRFPASGRRRRSYDSLLHAFAKKTSPSRLRRASKLRFRWARPLLSNNFQENLMAFTPLFGANRRRHTARRLSSVAYLSAPTRELWGYRAVSRAMPPLTEVPGAGTKRRFLSLPAHELFVAARRAARKAAFPYKQHTYIARFGLLRRALRRRRRSRAYIDLRQSTRHRRLPREKAKGHKQIRRRQNPRRRTAARRGRYSRSSARKRSKSNTRWALKHLSAVGPKRGRRRKAKLPRVLSYGEDISLSIGALRKRTRGVRGFTLPLQNGRRRKLRRQLRDNQSRKRRTRRGRRANRVRGRNRFGHWSEKRLRGVRKSAFTNDRHSAAKRILPKVRGKFAVRFAKRRVARANTRLSSFFARKGTDIALAPAVTTNIAPTATLLENTSYARDRETLWQLRTGTRLEKRRYRSEKFGGVAVRDAQVTAELTKFRERNSNSVPSRLVANLNVFPVTTPLWFELPLPDDTKSAATKLHERFAAIEGKEGGFQIPTQYVEGVTTLIPELISCMISRKIKDKKLTYEAAKLAIRNIYWSLRVYLNVDPFDSRFMVRDLRPNAGVYLREKMGWLAWQQNTRRRRRAALRYRFQPARLVRAKNTVRFRGDWLRAFFPARHSLYQENPEDYTKFLLASDTIRRLRIGPRAMNSWATEHQLIGQETRARKLLKLRFSRRRHRFETLLQTTRRLPLAEHAPTAPAPTRDPFFVRRFSTHSNRGLVLATRWIHRQKRFISLTKGWRSVAPASLVLARHRVLSRLEARGKTRYVTTDIPTMLHSFVHENHTRAKSPRSRQYILRSPRRFARTLSEKKMTDLIFYRKLVEHRALSAVTSDLPWTRKRQATWSFTFKRPLADDGLTVARRVNAARRTQSALFARARRKVATESARSVLHYRMPSARTASVVYKKGAALGPSSIVSRRRLKRIRRAAASFVSVRAAARKLKTPHARSFFPKWSVLPKKLRLGQSLTSGHHNRSIPGGRVRRLKGYFRVVRGRHVVRKIDFAKASAMVKRVRRQTLFETHRPKLWNKLTLRWMKKLRIGRYWLRETTHWLRDPWLSKIVAVRKSAREDRFGGEISSRPQQIGEYVAEVDDEGKDIPEEIAPRERHKFEHRFSKSNAAEFRKVDHTLKNGDLTAKMIVRHRLLISKMARRKPIPTMELADYEYQDVIREHEEEKAKSPKQKEEEEAARVKEYWERKAAKLPPIRPLRLPLKHPANLWLPHVIWKDIQRRIRKFEWRESDQVFARRGYKSAFRFKLNERRSAPWLEHLIYTRATYSTRLKSFRRRQFPHEQKKFKWLQRVRKNLYPGRRRRYIKRRRWSQLRRYNQKLHYSLFDLRDRGAARRHFKRLNGRTRPHVSAFVSMSQGLTNRLDVTCLHMNFAPSIYWARIVSEFGLLRVNGVTIYDPSYRLQPGDVVYPNWDTVARFQHFFKPYMSRRAIRRRRNKTSTAFYPTNMEYHRSIRAIVYKHAPDESDLGRRSRVRPLYFRWFKLDSV